MSFTSRHEKGARPLAQIVWPHTEFDRQTVYLSPEKPEAGPDAKEEKKVVNLLRRDSSPLDTLGTDFFRLGREGRKVKQTDLVLVKKILDDTFVHEVDAPDADMDLSSLDERPDVQEFLASRLQEAKKEIKSRRRGFDLEAPGYLIPLMDSTSRECCFIVGKSKSGKSTFAAWKMKSYRRSFPQNPIYLIVSPRVEGDPAFKDIPGITKVVLDEQFVRDVNDDKVALSDCLVVFDDVDSMADKKLKEAVWKLRAQILETGRHGSIYVLNTSHVFRAGKATHAANNEATSIVLFPSSGEKYHTQDYLKHYAGLNKDQRERIMNLGSRWVEVVTQAPSFVLHERGGYFL